MRPPEDEPKARVAFPARSSDSEARAFLQERLGLLGRVYALLAIGFLVLEQMTLVVLSPRASAASRDPGAGLILAAAAVTGALWWTCRRGPLPEARLLTLDVGAALLVAMLNAGLVFAAFPGELAGSSHTRAVLAASLALVLRSILVPSSPRRTLLLGLAGAASMVAASAWWHAGQGRGAAEGVVHAAWTALFGLGAVAISTVASRSIFGLREQVREASQLGQYTLLEKIGEGGMGVVYRASHAMLRRPTAVKLLPPGQAGADRLQRFEREVQMTSRLTHPNTVAIYDYGRTPDGVFYYAMEYLEGLEPRGADAPRRPAEPRAASCTCCGRSPRRSPRRTRSASIHRDVKPANVILVPQRGRRARRRQGGGLRPGQGPRPGHGPLARRPDRGHAALHLARGDHGPGQRRRPQRPLLARLRRLLPADRPPVFEGRNMVEVCGHHLHTRPEPPATRLGAAGAGRARGTAALLPGEGAVATPRVRRASSWRRSTALADVPPWTNEQARAWWSTRGAPIVARVRTEAKAPRPARKQELSALDTMSFVRRAAPEPRS